MEPRKEVPVRGQLEQSYGYPPFSVLDARTGRWQARKHVWRVLGLMGEVGRGAVHQSMASLPIKSNGASRNGLTRRLLTLWWRSFSIIGSVRPAGLSSTRSPGALCGVLWQA